MSDAELLERAKPSRTKSSILSARPAAGEPRELTYSRGRNVHDAKPIQQFATDMADFIAKLNADRAPVKNGAAYFCGPLGGDGRRRAMDALACRWIAVDLDQIDPEVLDDVTSWFEQYSGARWHTHSSTPDAPRLRVIIELDRPATRDHRMATGKLLMGRLEAAFGKLVTVDGCTFRPEQPVLVPPVGRPIVQLKGGPLAVMQTGVQAQGSMACTEEDRGFRKPSSVSSVSSVQTPADRAAEGTWTIPNNTIPTRVGQRNQYLFRFARYVKGLHPQPSRAELRAIVRAWHLRAMPTIQTQEFAVSFGEFMHAYDRVQQPLGAVLGPIAEGARSTPLPRGIEQLGYGSVCNQLVKICAALQAHENDAPFFLSARQAGELLEVPYTDANRMMQTLALDGVIQVVTKGAGRKASRYRYLWSSRRDSLT